MNRYEASTWTSSDGERTYPVVLKDGWQWPYIDRPMLAAEAHIIAFALNAVSEGHSLYWCAKTNDILMPYDGPTEGVAP